MAKNVKKSINKNITEDRSYINDLKLKGFRGYLNSTKINFGKKLTLIFGKGSTGKSTLLEAVKCLSASNINGVTKLIINKMDILDEIAKYRIFNGPNMFEFDSSDDMEFWISEMLKEKGVEVVFSRHKDRI